METQIINVNHPLLKDLIQSFLFFKTNAFEEVNYTTFPNTNVCLAVYRQNKVNYTRTDRMNKCEVSTGTGGFQSRIYGFHQQPFQVNIKSVMDEVCILFQPGALRAFTNESFELLMESSEAFNVLFPGDQHSFLDRLFEETDLQRRAGLLEGFLLKKISCQVSDPVHTIMSMVKSSKQSVLKVDDIADRLNINASTLYRLFYTRFGQSPKAFLQTVRFRQSLNGLIRGDQKLLTDIAYSNEYYDQAHFIKNIKGLSGITPGKLKKSISVEQEQLAWIYSPVHA
jgi:AraC-like DNA-binding protein